MVISNPHGAGNKVAGTERGPDLLGRAIVISEYRGGKPLDDKQIGYARERFSQIFGYTLDDIIGRIRSG